MRTFPVFLLILVVALCFTACQQQPVEVSDEVKLSLQRMQKKLEELNKQLNEAESTMSSFRSVIDVNFGHLQTQIDKIKANQNALRDAFEELNSSMTSQLTVLSRGRPWPVGYKILLVIIILVLIVILFKLLRRKEEEITEIEEFETPGEPPPPPPEDESSPQKE